MIEKFVSKDNLKKILKILAENTNLVAPSMQYGDIVFQEVSSINDVVFNYENCLNAPKDYLLGNEDVLFRYSLKYSKIKKERFSPPEIVIFGSRACDTAAVGLLDKFFSKNFDDPLYFTKRNSLLIITLVCNKLGESCFCNSTQTGPYLESGFDIQLIDIRNGYFLQAYSSKGKKFVKKFASFMHPVDKNKEMNKKNAIEKTINSKKKDFNLKRVFSNIDKMDIKNELWQDLSQRCQSCGGCLLICPSCSCFYVEDKKINSYEGQRVRNLDSCFYEGFTRMSANNNPVTPKESMMRRKFYHKLWQQINEFGSSGCSGCGRCNNICPGNINWLDVIKRIEKKSR